MWKVNVAVVYVFFLRWSSFTGIREGIRVEFIVIGEALGFVKDELLRNHLPRMFSLITNESKEIEDDQIPLRVFSKSISVRTRMVENFTRQRKLWWRLVAILTFTSFAMLGQQGNRPTEQSSSFFPQDS